MTLLTQPPVASGDPLATLRTWEPLLQPIYAVARPNHEGSGFRKLESGQAVIRSDNGAELAVVGPRQRLVPNRDKVELFSALVDRGHLHSIRCGQFDGGAKVWLQGQPSDGTLSIAGREVQARLTLCDAYDGSMSLALVDSDVCIVCRNTFARAAKTGTGLRLRHTASIGERFTEAVMAIKQSLAGFRESIMAIDSLTKVSMPHTDWKAFLDTLWPLHEDKGGTDDVDAKNAPIQDARNRLSWALEASPGAMPGTRFGAYMAVTHYLTHERGRNGHRLESNWLGESAKLNRKALAYLLN
jgi:phage/plasmid-like protein (TIGR03299 family)